LLSFPGCPVLTVVCWLSFLAVCFNVPVFMSLYLQTTGSSAHEKTSHHAVLW
jgi:hypothetical protein